MEVWKYASWSLLQKQSCKLDGDTDELSDIMNVRESTMRKLSLLRTVLEFLNNQRGLGTEKE